MSFFTFNVDDKTNKRWEVSENFWIYWVITLPLTALTLLCWRYGQSRKVYDAPLDKPPSW